MDYTSEEIVKLRQEEDWLNSYNLADDVFYLIVTGMTRVILGRDSLNVFYDKTVAAVKDKKIADKIALQAAMLRFLPFRQDIAGLDNFIKKLGGTVPPPELNQEPKEEEAEKTVAQKDIEPAANAAKMVFSSTDEEEVKSMPAFEHQVPSADDYAAQAQAIIKDFGFKDKDEVIMKRLQNFVVAKLRDVRDDIETLEVLTKSRKIGGMELDEEKARFLIKIIKDKEGDFRNGQMPETVSAVKPKIEFPVYQQPPEKKNISATANEPAKPLTLEEKREKDGFSVQDTRYKTQDTKEILEERIENLITDNQDTKKKRFGGLPDKGEVYPIIEEEDGLPVIRMPEEVLVASKILPPQKLASEIQSVVAPKKEEPAPIIPAKPEVVVPKEELKAELPVEKPANLPPARPRPYIAPTKTLPPKPAMMSAKRPSLDDVKFVRKLIGPIEELETMTIIDFRRISSDPVVAAKKIKEKVTLLEKELYTKRAEGILAWHKSEVSRFYRLLGQASMAEGRGIEQIIAERQQAGKPTLTLEEFNAIMELNRELRY